jgi:hypothetical protein
VVPQLALFDIKAREIRELVGPAATIPPEKHERSVALVEEIGGSPDGILDQLLSAHHSVKSVAPPLVEYLASNLNREYCTLEEFTGLFAGSDPKAEQKEKVVETVRKAEARLSAAQISTTCTP